MSQTGRHLNIFAGQLNPIVGDVAGNIQRAREARNAAAKASADLLVLTELFISGYPPEDLVLRPAFIDACREAIEALTKDTAAGGPAIIVGAPWLDGGKLFNSALLLDRGDVAAVRHKVELPNYGVFDEKRVFAVGPDPTPIDFNGVRIGLPICEDLWSEDFCRAIGGAGAELLISIHGSPYWRGKAEQRHAVARMAVAAAGCPVLYVNMVGGQDEFVFDGASFAMVPTAPSRPNSHASRRRRRRFRWRRTLAVSASRRGQLRPHFNRRIGLAGLLHRPPRLCRQERLLQASSLACPAGSTRRYGAAIAVDALGADRVRCVMLPYRFTSDQSRTDATACAKALGVRLDTVAIEAPIAGFETALSDLFAGRARDVTEENLQARTRGVLLMAISNKFGELLITTGNKSEVSVGYATLYGDMNGGFNPIKDLFKTEVYRLAAWRNRHHSDALKGPAGEVIPRAIITRAPTAELRENQTDQDLLPPYDTLDAILVDLIENERSLADIIAAGHDAATVRKVAKMVTLAEYKRRQAAPGVKISRRNFGRDRRYPITNRFVED